MSQVKSQQTALTKAEQLTSFLLKSGVEGSKTFKSAEQVAEEALKSTRGDRNKAIKKVIALHARTTGTAGFVTGLGGLATLPVAIPADLSVYYLQATRMVGAIAVIQGYDLENEEVKSIILVSLIGAIGTEAVNKLGINVAGKAGVAALKKLPGRALIEINKKVGFRLLTKFGEKGAINLVKVIPVVAGGVGAGINVVGMTAIGKHAQKNFPYEPLNDTDS